jgi:hypothetical protein
MATHVNGKARAFWNIASQVLAPEGVEVETKIHDKDGERNVQTLRRRGRLWWIPDGSMYVYYTPTHWRLRADETLTEAKKPEAQK